MNSELLEDVREIVEQLDDYLLQLHMAGLVIPIDVYQNSMSSLKPFSCSCLIVDFTKQVVDDNGDQILVDKTSLEFVRDLKYDYLAWYHSVSNLSYICI
jgi:hypothetical protein